MPVVPKKQFGQHFLTDENILGVIGRLAELEPSDVVLEIGPGLGILTRFLAETVSQVHAVELDRSLEPHLRPLENVGVELHWGDALALDLAALRPAPTKLVANLPYNVATPVVLESLEGLPSLELWCVMVQREVADRFFASPSTKAYGAVSVLVQLAATQDRVPSRLPRRLPSAAECRLGARRLQAAAAAARLRERQAGRRGVVRAPPQNAAELAGAGRAREPATRSRGTRGDRARGQRACRGARAGRVRRLGRGVVTSDDAMRAPASAKLNLALVVGPRRADGKHEVATVLQRLDLGDRIAISAAPRLTVTGYAGDTLVRRALEELAAAAGVEPRWAGRDHEAGSGGGWARRR